MRTSGVQSDVPGCRRRGELPVITDDARRDVLRFCQARQDLEEEVKGISYVAYALGALR